MGELTIMSFNAGIWTRNICKNKPFYWVERMKAMKRMIEKEKPDIICFQEMLFPATTYIPKDYKSAGLSITHPIYYRKDLNIKPYGHKFLYNMDRVLFDINGKTFQIISVHSHWDIEKITKNCRQIQDFVDNGKEYHTVACGDFNNTLYDIEKINVLKMKSSRAVLGIGEDVDTFIHFYKPNESHAAIDHFFQENTKSVSYHMISDNYGCDRMSDHFPIILTVII